MIQYNNEIQNMNSIMYSIFNNLPPIEPNTYKYKNNIFTSVHSVFNNLPIELVRTIKIYVGIISKDILFIYDRLKSKGIKWAIYEKPTHDIHRIVKIIPLLFKKGKYIFDWDAPDPQIKNTNLQIYEIENNTLILTRCSDYDLNIYDFEYLYNYTIDSLKTFQEEIDHRPFPIRNIYISRLDLMISFLLLGYTLDDSVFNYNIHCICKLNYYVDFSDDNCVNTYYEKRNQIMDVYLNSEKKGKKWRKRY
jgi:hypothetical protein